MPDSGRAAHPRAQLDDAFVSPLRFSLMAALDESFELDFATLGNLLDANDSALSKGISALERAGYVRVRKGLVASRPRTWIRRTAKGSRAFAVHVEALQRIVAFGERKEEE